MSRRISQYSAEFEEALKISCTDVNNNDEMKKCLRKALAYVVNNELTERQKLMITLYYYQNMNTVEIAESLGVNKSTVSRTLSKARLRILSRLKWIISFRA